MTLDDDEPIPALEQWKDRLASYLDGQEGIEALRARKPPHPPWPEQDNPMVGYLVARAIEPHEEDGVRAAIIWLAVHAWLESALDTRAALIRQLGW